MKIHLIGTITGTRNGVAWPPAGSVIDLPDDEAHALISGKMAKPFQVVKADVVETADAPADKIEKAVRKPRKGLTTKDV